MKSPSTTTSTNYEFFVENMKIDHNRKRESIGYRSSTSLSVLFNKLIRKPILKKEKRECTPPKTPKKLRIEKIPASENIYVAKQKFGHSGRRINRFCNTCHPTNRIDDKKLPKKSGKIRKNLNETFSKEMKIIDDKSKDCRPVLGNKNNRNTTPKKVDQKPLIDNNENQLPTKIPRLKQLKHPPIPSSNRQRNYGVCKVQHEVLTMEIPTDSNQFQGEVSEDSDDHMEDYFMANGRALNMIDNVLKGLNTINDKIQEIKLYL